MSETNIFFLYPVTFLQNNMEQSTKNKQSEYTLGDTGPNRAGLFARVSPNVLSEKMVRGLRFSNSLRS